MFVYCEKDELCLPAKEFGQYPSTLGVQSDLLDNLMDLILSQ